jgi:hypothetical protein
VIDPQNDAQMLAYWSAIPNLPQKDPNSPGAAHQGECPRCAMRNVCEVFSAQVAATGAQLHFAKDCAMEKVRGKEPLVIPPALLSFLALRNGIVEAHVSHVAEIETPGIIVFGAIMVNGQQSLLAFLIDGTHRAIAAVRTGREFKAYCLGARETAYCLLETETWMAKGKVIAHDAVDFAFGNHPSPIRVNRIAFIFCADR